MTSTDLVGFTAASLTTLAFVPQVLHSYRTRDVSSISLGMYCLFTVGIALWLVYGVLTHAWPVIIANTVTLGLAASILWLKLTVRSLKSGSKG